MSFPQFWVQAVGQTGTTASHNTQNGQKCCDSHPPFRSTVPKGNKFPCSTIITRTARRRRRRIRGPIHAHTQTRWCMSAVPITPPSPPGGSNKFQVVWGLHQGLGTSLPQNDPLRQFVQNNCCLTCAASRYVWCRVDRACEGPFGKGVPLPSLVPFTLVHATIFVLQANEVRIRKQVVVCIAHGPRASLREGWDVVYMAPHFQSLVGRHRGLRQGLVRMAAHRRRRGVPPPLDPPPPIQTKVAIVGKNQNLPSGESCRAIFGTQTFAPSPPVVDPWKVLVEDCPCP